MGRVQSLNQVLILFVIADISISQEHGHSVPTDEKVQETHPLINLGNSLKHRLNTLSSPHGILLYKDFQNYYNKLSDFYRLLKHNDAADIAKGLKVFEEIEKTGGPPHLNVSLNYSELKMKYNWEDSGEMKDIKEVLMLTKELWEDMEDRVAHLRLGQPEPELVEESTMDWTPFLREVSSGSEVSHY